MKSYDFDQDIYHKCYLEQNSLTESLIEDHLKLIQDLDYAFQFCLKKAGATQQSNIQLLNFALKKFADHPQRNKFRLFQERLTIFMKISKGMYFELDWVKFRDCDILNEILLLAQQNRFSDISIVIKYSSEVNFDQRKIILESIPFHAPPSEYYDLVPQTPEWFIEHAKHIDENTGRSDLIVELIQCGLKQNPSLQIILDYAKEFHFLVSKGLNQFEWFSWEQYLGMNDEERLSLFIFDQSEGIPIANALTIQLKTLVDRSPLLLEEILKTKFEKMFRNSQFSQKIKFYVPILKIIDQQKRKPIVQFILRNQHFKVGFQLSQTILDSWKQFLEEEEDNFLLKLSQSIVPPIDNQKLFSTDLLILIDSILSTYEQIPDWDSFKQLN